MKSHFLHFLALSIILVCCKKDETEQLDRIRSIQGTYTGTLTMESKTFGLYKVKQNTIEITVRMLCRNLMEEACISQQSEWFTDLRMRF